MCVIASDWDQVCVIRVTAGFRVTQLISGGEVVKCTGAMSECCVLGDVV